MLRFWALLFLVAPLPTVWSWAGTSVASLSSRRQHRVTRSAAAASWEIPGGGLGSVNRFFNSVKNFSRARRKPVNSKDAAVDSSSTRVHTGTDAEVASVRDKGNWKALGELASADKGLLFVSSLSLVMAALCDAGLPKYSAAALSSIVASDTAGFAAAMKGFLLLSAVRFSNKAFFLRYSRLNYSRETILMGLAIYRALRYLLDFGEAFFQWLEQL